MSNEYALLFQPLTIKHLALRNRIVLPPMMSNRNITDGIGVAWYRQFAEGGVGLVIVEATRTFRFDEDMTADSLKPLVEAVHEAGAAIALQLYMAPENERDTPGKMTRGDIELGIRRFAKAAKICEQAGFDGVEPHGAHGFLLNQFFSRKDNQRTDDYGGDLEGRMRMGLDAVRAIREVVSDSFLLLYRHTPDGGDGYSMEESFGFARELVQAGVDVLDLSPSSDKAPADKAAPFKDIVSVPLIAVNRLSVHERAVEALANHRCDLVAIGRGLIADPEWPTKTHRGRIEEIIKCTECSQGCFGNLSAGLPVQCVQRG